MKLLSAPIQWRVYARGNPASSAVVGALSEPLAMRAGGIVLGVSADKLCAFPVPVAPSKATNGQQRVSQF